ncbi:MAG: ATP-binding cassette domain-containing protein, partial [Gemmatimonadota bacterium]|nr:ATP-binding cassette domain-containing protein [Gemmatimonadota bacterium]
VFGLLGSGIDQLGRAIYGALGPLPGARIALGGAPYIPANPRQGRDAGIGFVAAERQREGIVPDLGVRANITLPFIDRFVRLFSVSKPREASHAQSWIDRLGIRAAHLDQPLRLLSGGNQQKACLARWLVEGLKVLILEEPTRGVDVGARHELYLALRQWTQKGLAVLLISSDAEEVAGVCDRFIVLDRGRVSSRFSGGVAPADLLHTPTAKDHP